MNTNDDTKLKSLLEKIAANEKIRDFQTNISTGAAVGEGYIGSINSVQITGKDDENKPKVLNLIVKASKRSEAMRETIPIEAVFKTEIHVYDVIFPIFRELEIENGLPPSRFCPKFYLGNAEDNTEMMLLENLKEAGYKLHDKKIAMDEEQVRAVVEQYGVFHALSLAFRNQHPDKFTQITKSLVSTWWDFTKKTQLVEIMQTRYEKALKECLNPIVDKEALRICKSLTSRILDFMTSLTTDFDDFSAIIHGDCWTNNMLFKYDDDTNNKHLHVDFVDFQLTRVGSPVLDLSYFFYTCSPKHVIDNYETYLQLYYNSLATHLHKLGKDPNSIYSYEKLKEHWKKYSKYGLLMSCILIYLMLTDKEEVVDISDTTESGADIANAFDYEISSLGEYNDRFKHILLHFVNNGFLEV